MVQQEEEDGERAASCSSDFSFGIRPNLPTMLSCRHMEGEKKDRKQLASGGDMFTVSARGSMEAAAEQKSSGKDFLPICLGNVSRLLLLEEMGRVRELLNFSTEGRSPPLNIPLTRSTRDFFRIEKRFLDTAQSLLGR